MNRILIALIAALVVLLGILLMRSSIERNKAVLPPGTEPTSTHHLALNVDDWKELVRNDLHFSIMLPHAFHHATDKSRDPRTKEILVYDTFVAADDEGQGYMINTITFPQKIDTNDVATTLTNVVTDIIARNSENKLNSIKEGKFKNYKALDFSYANGNRTIHGKVFAVTDTVYMLGVIDTTPENDSKELDYFMNSFEIVNDPTKEEKK